LTAPLENQRINKENIDMPNNIENGFISPPNPRAQGLRFKSTAEYGTEHSRAVTVR
jgi:hypothetical protein